MSKQKITAAPADGLEEYLLNLTRRRFFGSVASTLGAGLGGLALAQLLEGTASASPVLAADGMPAGFRPGPHFTPKAKRVIYMHMEGAPSQLDLYDYKPELVKRFDQDLPDSVRNGQRITGMTSGQSRFPVAPTKFRFDRFENNEDGLWLSEILPYTGTIAKDMCLINSMHTDAINHEPGITFFQTGTEQPGRPSFGSWMSYGLGSMNSNLPAFVVMITQGVGNMQALSARFWGSGFLPSEHQGCRLRSGRDPVLYLRDPDGVSREDRRRMLDLVGELNEEEFKESLDPEVRARIAQHEMAYRMQMSVPDLTDFSDEDPKTLELYGPDVHKPGSFAANCLLARRLAERDVRFIQLYMRGWDQHGNLPAEMRAQSKAVDQPQAALIKDLRRRGLLDQTLIVCGGEFGRTPVAEFRDGKRDFLGRDHHPHAFSIWMAGGGTRGGHVHGATDDLGYRIARDPVSVRDLQATILHLLGFDHERLTYRHNGLDHRLTGVQEPAKVVRELLA